MQSKGHCVEALYVVLADRGECELLAVVTNRKDKTNASAAAVDAINTYYGRPNIPIGTDKVGPTDLQRTSSYTRALRDADWSGTYRALVAAAGGDLHLSAAGRAALARAASAVHRRTAARHGSAGAVRAMENASPSRRSRHRSWSGAAGNGRSS